MTCPLCRKEGKPLGVSSQPNAVGIRKVWAHCPACRMVFSAKVRQPVHATSTKQQGG